MWWAAVRETGSGIGGGRSPPPGARRVRCDLIMRGITTVHPCPTRGPLLLLRPTRFAMIRGSPQRVQRNVDLCIPGYPGVISGGDAGPAQLKGTWPTWMVPGEMVKGLERAMDICLGRKRVVGHDGSTRTKGAARCEEWHAAADGARCVGHGITGCACWRWTRAAGRLCDGAAPGVAIEDVKARPKPNSCVR